MTQVAIESSVSRKLSQYTEPVQLVDDSGRVLGVFRPPVSVTLYRDVEPPLSLDELRRRASSQIGHTTEEVLRHLEGR
jgi:hypothetical protein